jgi:acyl dehydratase
MRFIYPVLAGDKIIEATTENDMRELARIFLSYTGYVIDNNNSKIYDRYYNEKAFYYFYFCYSSLFG